jgi:hypothetical protein
MFNDHKNYRHYVRPPVDARKRALQDRRLTYEAWLEMILIVVVAALVYVILVGP